MMALPLFEKITFTTAVLEHQKLEKGEYYQCIFDHLEWSAVDFCGYIFEACTFNHCNLSVALFNHTSMRQIRFVDCKLLGVKWDVCNPFLFSVSFDRCIIDMCSFFGLKMKKTMFRCCSMKEVDFTEADLSESILDDCDLSGAVFDHTNLRKANLSTARQYIIDPQTNVITGASFSWPALSGLLVKFNIHIQN